MVATTQNGMVLVQAARASRSLAYASQRPRVHREYELREEQMATSLHERCLHYRKEARKPLGFSQGRKGLRDVPIA